MIERAFDKARRDEGNKGNALRQRAIERAINLLKKAGVVDPAILDQAVSTTPQIAVKESPYFIPEGIGVRSTLYIGGKSLDQLEFYAKSVRNVNVYGYALDMMHNRKFTILGEVTPLELIKLPVSALGLPGVSTTKQIFERASQCRVGDMALELCRAEVGPHLAIKDTEQPLNDYYFIMHEQIIDRHGLPRVFELGHYNNSGRHNNGLWLRGAWANPGTMWSRECQLVFALRKVEL